MTTEIRGDLTGSMSMSLRPDAYRDVVGTRSLSFFEDAVKPSLNVREGASRIRNVSVAEAPLAAQRNLHDWSGAWATAVTSFLDETRPSGVALRYESLAPSGSAHTIAALQCMNPPEATYGMAAYKLRLTARQLPSRTTHSWEKKMRCAIPWVAYREPQRYPRRVLPMLRALARAASYLATLEKK